MSFMSKEIFFIFFLFFVLFLPFAFHSSFIRAIISLLFYILCLSIFNVFILLFVCFCRITFLNTPSFCSLLPSFALLYLSFSIFNVFLSSVFSLSLSCLFFPFVFRISTQFFCSPYHFMIFYFFIFFLNLFSYLLFFSYRSTS